MRNPITAAIVAALVTAAAFVALGAGGGQNVHRVAGTSGYNRATDYTTYRDGLDAADVAEIGDPTAAHDGTTDASIATITSIFCGGYQNVRVSGRFTNSGATAPLACVRMKLNASSAWVVVDVDEQTMTASDNFTWSSEYGSANALTFDTAGADVVKILIDGGAVSAGSLDLFVECF